MGSINKVFLIGRLTGLPDLRYTTKGTPVAEISLAVNRYWSDDAGKHEEVTFVDVTLWARQAEIAQQYLKKGSPVLIEGRLQLDTWEDKQSGQKRSRLRVIAENLQLIGDRSATSSAQPAPSQGAPRPGLPEPDLDV
jgi:single-strand DNA-binding protein